MASTGTGNKMVFTCANCGYRARIPETYAGKTVTCPGCRAPQIAKPASAAESEPTGYSARLSKMQTVPEDDKFVFGCTGCGYRARIPREYNGKSIHCPACKLAQVASEAAPGASSGLTAIHAKVHIAPITPMPEPIALPHRNPEAAAKADRIIMTCVKCAYRARIPAKYVGIAVHCPSCNSINVPKSGEVATDSIPRKSHSDKLIAAAREGAEFSCGQCGYSGRISAMVASGTIYCPACRAPQSLDTAAVASPSGPAGGKSGSQRRGVASGIAAASALSPKASRREAQTETDSDLLPMNTGSELEEEEAAEAAAAAAEVEESIDLDDPTPPGRKQISSRRLALREPGAESDYSMLDEELGPSMAHSPSVRYFIQTPRARLKRSLIVTIMFLATGGVLAGIWYQQRHNESVPVQAQDQRESARLRAELERTIREQERLKNQLEEAGRANLELLKKSVATPVKPQERVNTPQSRFPSAQSRVPYQPVDTTQSNGPSRVILGDNLEPEDSEPVY